MKHAALVLAFLPCLAFAAPVTFTFDVHATDLFLPDRTDPFLPPIPGRWLAGQMKFTFDDTKRRVVDDYMPYGSFVSYVDQTPLTFTSPLGTPDDTVYAVGARVFNTGYGPSGVIVSMGGSSFSVDDKGVYSQYGISIYAQFMTVGFPLLDADYIVKSLQNSEKLTFQAYSISFTNFPQPASNFVRKFNYVDENVKLVDVLREADVPEPATLMSAMLGLGLMGFMRRR
jgi:hypothetical protein